LRIARKEADMDALLGSRWHWRATDWTAAAVAGFAAGAVLMVLDLIWSTIFNLDGPWRTSHMIAPIFVGSATPPASGYAFSAGVVAIALATHYVLGIVFGLVMAAVLSMMELDTRPVRAGVSGAIMGMVLYLVNFELVAVRVFPWLQDLRGADTMAAHVVFGSVAALLYWRLKRTTPES
jgi:hypothetical protein